MQKFNGVHRHNILKIHQIQIQLIMQQWIFGIIRELKNP